MIALLICLQSAELLEKHVRYLASPALEGRNNGSEGGRKAAEYVAEKFREAGLKPGGPQGYFQDFDFRGAPSRNVLGLLEGESKEVVVVAAHHDGHGVLKGKVQPGADDNATGVALVLEVARELAKTKPKRSILFISFDAEEDGLVGSREFARAELYPDVAAAFVFDLVGGRLFEWETDRLYAMGSESSERLSSAVRSTKVDGLSVLPMGVFLIEPYPDFARSDYAAFRSKGVPFVFFSTGTPWYYHTEHDTPEVIDFPKLGRVTAYAKALALDTANGPERPAFRKAAPSKEDLAVVRDGLKMIVKRSEILTWPPGKYEAAQAALEEISALTEPEPKAMHKAMMLMLTVAKAQGKK
ncbi:MAG TPA: M20/M25/M40 family metallo-hydrolase [Planctomycetota bacterium]